MLDAFFRYVKRAQDDVQSASGTPQPEQDGVQLSTDITVWLAEAEMLVASVSIALDQVSTSDQTGLRLHDAFALEAPVFEQNLPALKEAIDLLVAMLAQVDAAAAQLHGFADTAREKAEKLPKGWSKRAVMEERAAQQEELYKQATQQRTVLADLLGQAKVAFEQAVSWEDEFNAHNPMYLRAKIEAAEVENANLRKQNQTLSDDLSSTQSRLAATSTAQKELTRIQNEEDNFFGQMRNLLQNNRLASWDDLVYEIHMLTLRPTQAEFADLQHQLDVALASNSNNGGNNPSYPQAPQRINTPQQQHSTPQRPAPTRKVD